MSEEKKNRLPADEAGEAEKREKAREMAEGLELLGELRAVTRRGGLILGAAVALLGWYLSQSGGKWYLIGGAALGAVIAGGALLSGGLTSAIAKKYMKSGKEK